MTVKLSMGRETDLLEEFISEGLEQVDEEFTSYDVRLALTVSDETGISVRDTELNSYLAMFEEYGAIERTGGHHVELYKRAWDFDFTKTDEYDEAVEELEEDYATEVLPAMDNWKMYLKDPETYHTRKNKGHASAVEK